VQVRGSDYISPGMQSFMGDRTMPNVLSGKAVSMIAGDVHAPHSWTSPKDVARTLVAVAADPRGWGRAWHVPSNPPRSMTQVVGDLAQAAGVKPVKVTTVPRPVVWCLKLVMPAVRELEETAHSRSKAYILDDSAARETFALEPTPWSEILAAMVEHYRPAKH
jgi:nucleoside-diphosphate-sugar epimerase